MCGLGWTEIQANKNCSKGYTRNFAGNSMSNNVSLTSLTADYPWKTRSRTYFKCTKC